ncbi:MAG: MBL fold metallo-hydrolase [Alphaproteobacteria bacterium]|nr:MBL fold metallo-hydrolase [Alphaproteobacteria bacterium]
MFDLTFLGTAATTPTLERGLPALLVGAPRHRFLIDCGEGTQRQLLRAGTGLRRLGHIFLTHAHLDHVLGLAGLIATLGLLDLRGGLTICGSEQTLRFVAQYLGAIWPAGRAPVPIGFAVLTPGVILEERDFSVCCFPVQHRGTESLGYRFNAAPRRHVDARRMAALGVLEGPIRGALARGEAVTLPDGRRIEPEAVLQPPSPGLSVAVIGDTEEVDTLVAPVAGADLLVIESTFMDADANLAAQRGHLTAGDAGRLAAGAGVGRLILTHLSGRYDPNAVRAEAAELFPNTCVADDFDKFAVTHPARSPASVDLPREDLLQGDGNPAPGV